MTIFTKLTQVKPEEFKGAIWSFLFIFILMASYYVMKPVRDSIPSDWGDQGLAVQWSVTFILSTIAVSVYNICASRISLQKLVPSVFVFFALSFIAIYVFSKFNLVDSTLLGKIFYAWVSVFSLYHISVFWSFTSQAYSRSESKRIFSFINTGASAGAIAGSLFVTQYGKAIQVELALLIVVCALIVVLPMIRVLRKIHEETGQLSETAKGNLSRSRQGWLAYLDLAINVMTILLGILATSRITQKFGLATALSIVPFFVAIFMLLLTLNTEIFVVLAIQFLRKSGNYAITRPAREIAYTGVSKEGRFKTKPIIDVAVYRGGDVFWAWIFVFLGTKGLNLDSSGKLIVGAAVAVAWALVGISMGRRYERTRLEKKNSLNDEAVENKA